MKRQSLALISFFFLFTGCAELYTGRTYLSEMESDDSRFFNPREDFPVVGGDTGRFWNTEEETKARTPASIHDLAEENRNRALHEELRDLEDTQSEGAQKFYQKYKHSLATTSERIYFLKLPPNERKEYLSSRGFLDEEKKDLYAPHERMLALRKQDILLGMSKEDVTESWGKPLRVEVAGNPSNENERWLYNSNGNQKYIYFESGQVQGWE